MRTLSQLRERERERDPDFFFFQVTSPSLLDGRDSSSSRDREIETGEDAVTGDT